ncbi:hypothetical protein FA95DRAFT_1679880 [Auriscalpium vulgare]|uniref:Uncharacterized protein n=1 Tax=Auriscalpium vulgare TaxID=40419 RepID=A0ACB8RQ64_9AGAM|nr:hypothetical protein FA95DRAFT_1679880 [Auriscalpium vulgare]
MDSGCALTDTKCLCSSAKYLQEGSDCIQQSCPADEAAEAIDFFKQLCAAVVAGGGSLLPSGVTAVDTSSAAAATSSADVTDSPSATSSKDSTPSSTSRATLITGSPTGTAAPNGAVRVMMKGAGQSFALGALAMAVGVAVVL